MSRAVRVLLLTPPGTDGAAAAGGGVECHVCTDLSDLLGRAAAGSSDLVAVSPRSAGVDASVVGRLRSIGCRVAAVTATGEDVDLAHRVGLVDCLALPLDPSAVRAVLDAPDRQRAVSPARAGRVVAVWGAPGSPGRTTTVALLAAAASRAGKEVVVVDTDLAGPAWCLMSPRPVSSSGLLVAARRAISGATDVSDLLVDMAPGVRGLLLAAEPERWIEVVPSAIGPVLSCLAESSDLVLVDVGADIRPPHPAYDIGWAHDTAAVARAALMAADVVTAVVGADPSGVHRFATWWPTLAKLVDPAVIVANRVGMPRAGRNPAQQVEAVLDALRCSGAPAEIPWDPKAADGLMQPEWAQARGWKKVPGRVLAVVEAALSAEEASRRQSDAPLRGVA